MELKEGDEVWLKIPAKVEHEPVNGYVYVSIGNQVIKVDIADLWTVKPETNDVLAKRIAKLEKENSTLRMENSIIPKFGSK